MLLQDLTQRSGRRENDELFLSPKAIYDIYCRNIKRLNPIQPGFNL